MPVSCNCEDTLMPQFNLDYCKANPNMNIKSLVFIKKSDCVSDDNGNFVRMKRKYGKFTRPLYNTKAEMMAYL